MAGAVYAGSRASAKMKTAISTKMATAVYSKMRPAVSSKMATAVDLRSTAFGIEQVPGPREAGSDSLDRHPKRRILAENQSNKTRSGYLSKGVVPIFGSISMTYASTYLRVSGEV
jgi:hypothetical protein